MPIRKHIFAEGEYYHIFNRSLNRTPIFSGKREANQFLNSLQFYMQETPGFKYSLFKKLKNIDIKPPYLVSVQAFVLMPNHFHFLLRQESTEGISIFMRRLIDSFSHYFNIKNERKGPLFEGRFRSVHIETEMQFLHVHRYIHLNPVTGYLVEDPADYDFSSYWDYVKKIRYPWIDTSLIIDHFRSIKSYEQFVLNNKDYQRSLDKIKHLILE